MKPRNKTPRAGILLCLAMLFGLSTIVQVHGLAVRGDGKSLGPIVEKYTIRFDGAVPLAGSFELKRDGLQTCQEPDDPPEIGEIIIDTHKITINLLVDYLDPKMRPSGVYQIQRDGSYVAIDREKEDEDLIFGPTARGASQSVLTIQKDGSGTFSFNHWGSSTGKSLSGTISWTCRQLPAKKLQ